jgi:hypothetical protein
MPSKRNSRAPRPKCLWQSHSETTQKLAERSFLFTILCKDFPRGKGRLNASVSG